jgi:hypothetical protein
MTYTTGQIINHADYNTFISGTSTGTINNSVANINSILGVGHGNIGYGQTTPLSQLPAVSTSNLVTAVQWSSLFSRITTVASHQGTTITTLPTITTGNVIHAVSALSSNLSAIYSGVGNATSSATSVGTPLTLSTTTSWKTQLTFTFTITFASGDAARYFFNAGGAVQLTFSRTGGSGSSKDTDWTNLCAACGTMNFGYNSTTRIGGSVGGPGSVAPPVALGYWQSTTSTTNGGQLIQKQYSNGVAPYNGKNYIQTNWYSNGTQGSNADVGSVLTFTVIWVDYATDNIVVDGTTATTCALLVPNNTYLSQSPPSWGSPVITGSGPTGS